MRDLRHAQRLLICMMCVGALCLVLAEALPGYVSTSVLNMTFTGAASGWPSTTAELAPTTEAITTAVCGRLPPTVASCAAFLIVSSAGAIAMQLSVDTDIASNASSVYTTLYDWSQNMGSPPTALIQTAAQNALGVALSTLAYESGAYSMPCRGQGVYSFLPVCNAAETEPNTSFYIRRTSGGAGDAVNSIRSHLCALQSACESASITVTDSSSTEPFAQVTIIGAAKALESILAYVSDVRAAATAQQSDVLRIEMRAGSMVAPLFSVNETKRFDTVYPVTLQCAPATGMWAIALIAIVPIALILFRYVWYRGRKHAKKVGRQRVIEDEQRIMQGYTTGGGGGGAAAAAGATTTADPPPGVDAATYQNATQTRKPTQSGASTGAATTQDQTTAAAQEQQQQWMMDSQGNYYLVGADNATTTSAGLTNNQQAGASPADDAQATGVEAVEMDQFDPTENSISYQTYVDPNTGETYQYVVDAQQAADGDNAAQAESADAAGGNAEAAAAAGEQSTSQYAQYVDPETGETYYYDTSAVQEESVPQQ